jgi:hypothetical protein
METSPHVESDGIVIIFVYAHPVEIQKRLDLSKTGYCFRSFRQNRRLYGIEIV